MNRTKLGLIHTSKVLIPVFEVLCEELLPSVEVLHIADDSLIKDAIAQGSLSDSIVERLQAHVRKAEQAGVHAIMVTCSSMGPAIEASREIAKVPLIRVDQAMAELAVSKASRIGVIATVTTTLRPTADLIERQARMAGKPVTVVMTLCDGAFEKLLAGDVEMHDRMVTEKLMALVSNVDIIVLAQASMARVATRLTSEQCPIPVLSSPKLAVESLAKRFRPATSDIQS